MTDTSSPMPIKSKAMTDMIKHSLYQQYPPYAVLFILLIGTGAPLPYLLTLKIGDLRFTGQLQFFLRSSSKRPIVSDIPYDDMQELTDYFDKKSDDEPAFPSITGKGVMQIGEFRMRLARTSKQCRLNRPLNETSLRKTFLYRLILEEGGPEKALDFMGWKSTKKLYAYVGITKLPVTDNLRRKVVVYDDMIIDKHLLEVLRLIEMTRKDIASKENTYDMYDASAIFALCADLVHAVNDYFNIRK